MAGKEHGLGELEMEVMQVVWDRQPCSVMDVATEMAHQRGCARTTVLTVMQRLHRKGYLQREKREGVFHYRATQPREKVMGGVVRQFVNRFLGGSHEPLVQYLADSNVSPEELQEIRDILDRAAQRKED